MPVVLQQAFSMKMNYSYLLTLFTVFLAVFLGAGLTGFLATDLGGAVFTAVLIVLPGFFREATFSSTALVELLLPAGFTPGNFSPISALRLSFPTASTVKESSASYSSASVEDRISYTFSNPSCLANARAVP